MATIYKAVQESLGRTVAIKALKPAVAQKSHFAVRFEREALSLSALQHENIIHIYDFHRVGDELYIVMEFVEGIDLYDLLERCPVLPADVAAIIALQVARALDYAHFRGVIHRDIKPANIMISKSGGIKLMDFGIARDQSFGDLTETGTGLGTPSYMSPEQILGDKIDFRSDIFALGTVLYQMLCGRKPFIEDPNKSVMHKIRLERPIPARKLNSAIPGELERIIERCMEKRRDNRFRSTQELVAVLERFVSRTVEVNYHARLVQFLCAQNVVQENELESYLHPVLTESKRLSAMRGSGLGKFAKQEALVLAVAVFVIGMIQLSPIGTAPTMAGVTVSDSVGRVRIATKPGTAVFVDGKYVDTTPISGPLVLKTGSHRLEFRNPIFRSETRSITVERDSVATITVDLHSR